MIDSHIIRPGIGYGSIKLGSRRSDIQKMIGPPNEIEENNDVEDDIDITWSYSDLKIYLYFDEEDDYRLGLIEIENPNAVLYESKILGMKLIETEQFLINNGITDLIKSNTNDEEIIESELNGLTLYFENKTLVSIQISPLFIDEDTIEWPR